MDYVQPVAHYLAWPERLLLRGEDDRWYVWLGDDPDDTPAEIAGSTARWLLAQPWICPLPNSTPWIHVDDLPLAQGACLTPFSPVDGTCHDQPRR